MNDYYEYIEDYITGSLNREDTIEFESAMTKDPNLSEAVQNFHLAKKLSSSLIEDETRQQLNNLKTKPKDSVQLKLLFTALIFAILISLYFLILKEKKQITYTKEQIFAQLYEAPASLASRNENSELSALNTAIQYFDKGDLKASYPIFESLLKADSTNLQVTRYLAHIHLQQSDYLKSVNYFRKIIEFGTPEQVREAEYNLTIIYLIQRKKEEATKLYNSLKSKNIISQKKMEFIKNYLEIL